MVKYRVSELARLLNVSDVAIRKRIKHGEFETVQEDYNKRKTIFVCLNDKQVKALGLNKKNSAEKCSKPQNIASDTLQTDEIKELISDCIGKYENFYNEYLTKIDELNKENSILSVENSKLKTQLSSVISKYNALAKRINADIARRNS